jgi:uncharacterized protein (DUF779 family)|tara:strand:- start:870 stop:1055 length:186 start_codon:yes stop_codon:yes gene_type:complete
MDDNFLKQHFFVLEEKDGTHSAYIRFAGFADKKQAQFIIDSIIHELGMIKVDQVEEKRTLH